VLHILKFVSNPTDSIFGHRITVIELAKYAMGDFKFLMSSKNTNKHKLKKQT